jgi:hypothetical protein
MDALLFSGQALAVLGLLCGCYLSIVNWDVSDEAGIQREFGKPAGSPGHAQRYDPMADPLAAGDAGLWV